MIESVPMLYPLTFKPIFKERVWGGRNLERLFQKQLPEGMPVGESWEITDRPEAVSQIGNGPLAGKSLRWLMEHHARELLGDATSPDGRFPLLVKILDAEDKLSLQVHPPAPIAARLGGEPKTELWYVVAARPRAELYVGLKRETTREEFTRRIQDGTVAQCFHRLSVRPGDAMFLPSGRVHAIGAGLVIFEIQQNSDTTYRVFDWHRMGLDGKPRELQVEQSLQSIDFADFEPTLVTTGFTGPTSLRKRTLVDDKLFAVTEHRSSRGLRIQWEGGRLTILGLLSGCLTVVHGGSLMSLQPGDFCLLPATLDQVALESNAGANFLEVTAGEGRDRPGPA